MGGFIITGSQQFGLLDSISPSLAGRVGLVQLLPLSLAEILQAANWVPADLKTLMFTGGYPALYDFRRGTATQSLLPAHWQSAYIAMAFFVVCTPLAGGALATY
jgi:uncharacterized protein